MLQSQRDCLASLRCTLEDQPAIAPKAGAHLSFWQAPETKNVRHADSDRSRPAPPGRERERGIPKIPASPSTWPSSGFGARRPSRRRRGEVTRQTGFGVCLPKNGDAPLKQQETKKGLQIFSELRQSSPAALLKPRFPIFELTRVIV